MKLTAAAIESFLKQPDKNCAGALVYGPDAGLVSERVKHIASHLVPDLADPFNVVELTEDRLVSDPALLVDELSAMSLMGGRRLVMLRDTGDKSTKIIATAFEAGAAYNAYLIVSSGELGPRSSLRGLFEKQATLAALPCYKDEGRNLESVIRDLLDQHRLRYDRDALLYLTQNLGNDRRVTMGEIEKLALYMGEEKHITLDIAEDVIGYNHDTTMDDICNAVAEGNPPALDAALARLMREGVQPVALVRSALKYFQRLYALQSRIMEGESAEQAMAGLRPPVFFRQAARLKTQLSTWPLPRIVRGLNRLQLLEKQLKSSGALPELLCSRALYALALKAA